jgi:hypothetical protein
VTRRLMLSRWRGRPRRRCRPGAKLLLSAPPSVVRSRRSRKILVVRTRLRPLFRSLLWLTWPRPAAYHGLIRANSAASRSKAALSQLAYLRADVCIVIGDSFLGTVDVKLRRPHSINRDRAPYRLPLPQKPRGQPTQ